MHFRIFRIFSTLEKCRPRLSFVTSTLFASGMTRWQDWVAKSSTLPHDVPSLMDHGDQPEENLENCCKNCILSKTAKIRYWIFCQILRARTHWRQLFHLFLSHFVSWNCEDLWVSARKFSPDLSDTWFLDRQDVSFEQDMNSSGSCQTSSLSVDL